MEQISAITVNSRIRQEVLTTIECAPGQSVKEKIGWAARVLRLPFERVRKYKYNHVSRIDAYEAVQIQLGADRARQAKRIRLEAELAIIDRQTSVVASEIRETATEILGRLVEIGSRGEG